MSLPLHEGLLQREQQRLGLGCSPPLFPQPYYKPRLCGGASLAVGDVLVSLGETLHFIGRVQGVLHPPPSSRSPWASQRDVASWF